MPKYFAIIASAERLMEIENLPEEESSNADDVDVPSVYRDLRALQFDHIDFRYDRM